MRAISRGVRQAAAPQRASRFPQLRSIFMARRAAPLAPRQAIHGLIFAVGLSVAVIGWAQPRPAAQMFEALAAVADQVTDVLEDLHLVPDSESDAADEPRTHIVESGETLRQLAAAYDVSVATIAWSNNLDDPDLIMPGQKLIIPSANAVIHSVAPSETLRQVARRYQADAELVARANSLPESLDEPIEAGHILVPDPQLPTFNLAAREPASTGTSTVARRTNNGVSALGEINPLNDASEPGAPVEPRAAAVPRSPVVYEVQSGDSLASLAAQFGVTVPTLLRANNITNPDLVSIGTKLRVLPVSGTEHEIKPGESLADLAAYYEVDLGPIIDFNGLLDPDMVRVGQALVIPGAAKGPRPVAPVAPVPSVARATQGPATAAAPASASNARPAAAQQTSRPAAGPAAVAAAPPPAVAGGGGAGLLKNAMNYMGARYVWGGTGPYGFDCSGFVWYVHKISGRNISRGLWGQLNGGPRISRDKLQPGDSVFFANTYMPGLSHAGIYIGGGRFIHAADERSGVTISSLSDGYWGPRYIGASRLY